MKVRGKHDIVPNPIRAPEGRPPDIYSLFSSDYSVRIGHVAWVENRVKAVYAALGTLPLEIYTSVYVTRSQFSLPEDLESGPSSLTIPAKTLRSDRPYPPSNLSGIRTITPKNSSSLLSPPLNATFGSGSVISKVKLCPDDLMETLNSTGGFAENKSTSAISRRGGVPRKSIITTRKGRPDIAAILQASCERSPGRILVHGTSRWGIFAGV